MHSDVLYSVYPLVSVLLQACVASCLPNRFVFGLLSNSSSELRKSPLHMQRFLNFFLCVLYLCVVHACECVCSCVHIQGAEKAGCIRPVLCHSLTHYPDLASLNDLLSTLDRLAVQQVSGLCLSLPCNPQYGVTSTHLRFECRSFCPTEPSLQPSV